jgi:hypothetical protein
MNAIELARLAIEKLKNTTKFETMLGTASILTNLLDESGLKAVIVGGFAVEIYTRSEYTTVDIDLIFSRRDLAISMCMLLASRILF